MKVAAVVAAVVLASGVAQGQILRWDNGQPIPGTEHVDPARYAAGDLTGYNLSTIDLSYADLHGRDLSGIQWGYSQGAKVDLRGTKWSDSPSRPNNWANTDLRGAYYLPWGQPAGLANWSGINSRGDMLQQGAMYGDRWLSIFNDSIPAYSGSKFGGEVYIYHGIPQQQGLWMVLDGGEWLQPVHVGPTQYTSTWRPMDLTEHPLRISFRYGSQVAAGKTYDLFDWVYGTANQFEFVEVPVGSKWDLTKIYSTGEARLIDSPVTSSTEFRRFYQSDLDIDADVDSADLLVMLEGWTGADYAGDPIGVDHGDVDADGDLDSGDLLVLLSQWTGAKAAERAQAVPEPAGLVLGLVGFLVMIRRATR